MYPEIDDVVYTKVIGINDCYVTVKLLEYDKEGVISRSELSRRRRHVPISTIVKMNDHIIARVIKVDVQKGHIELSKKTVTLDEAEFLMSLLIVV